LDDVTGVEHVFMTKLQEQLMFVDVHLMQVISCFQFAIFVSEVYNI